MGNNDDKKEQKEKKEKEEEEKEEEDILKLEEEYAEILKQLKILNLTQKEMLRVISDKFEPKLPL